MLNIVLYHIRLLIYIYVYGILSYMCVCVSVLVLGMNYVMCDIQYARLYNNHIVDDMLPILLGLVPFLPILRFIPFHSYPPISFSFARLNIYIK